MRVTLADRVFAWTVSIGEGLIVFMLVWLIGARATELFWTQPAAAITAMASALLAATLWTGWRGTRRVAPGKD